MNLGVDENSPEKIREFLDILFGDIAESNRNLESADSGYNRRAVVRSVASAIEATIWVLKHYVLSDELLYHKLHPAQIALLREETYEVDDRGKAISRKRFLPTAENLKFVLTAYSELCNKKNLVDFSGSGWNNLRKTLKTRNNVVHPKKLSDLQISNNALKATQLAFEWYRAVIMRLIDDIEEHVRKEKDAVQKRLDELPTAYWRPGYPEDVDPQHPDIF